MTNDLIGKRGASIKKDMTILTGLTVWGETVKKVKTVNTKNVSCPEIC